MEAIIEAYRIEDAAADALYAYLDSGEIEAGNLAWPTVERRVVTAMQLPPGARFCCSIVSLNTSGRDARTDQPIQPYSVHLEEASSLPSSIRLQAEHRYAAALDHALGGPDKVAVIYRAWVAAGESEPSALDKATTVAAMKWPRAADQAEQAGFYKLGELPGAHF